MTTSQTIATLGDLQTLCESRLPPLFESVLNNIPALILRESMLSALKNGGKRLRPLLVYATAPLFNTPLSLLDAPAAAIEMIHTYSLIHDDLPCMDNADFRRGQPACHKVYGEGMAVLAGDALQTLAMDMILKYPSELNAERRLRMLGHLSEASGPLGMAAGQALDITLMSDTSLSLPLLETIYRLKTGALLSCALTLGWLASPQLDEVQGLALKHYGDAIGLAFQIQDDILDIETSSAELGKPQGIDNINNKYTYPRLAGLDEAKARVETLYEQAMESLNAFGSAADLLRGLTHQLLFRKK